MAQNTELMLVDFISLTFFFFFFSTMSIIACMEVCMSNEIDTGMISKSINWAYDFVNSGCDNFPGFDSPDKVAGKLLQENNGNVGLAVDAAVSMHSKETAIAGALTCIGGLVMLPAGIIVDVANLFAMQLRMLQTIALLRGLDIYDDRVKKICILCLAGSKLSDKVLKDATIKMALNASKPIINYLAKETVIEVISRYIVFDFVSKGAKWFIKAAPIIGGVVGAGFDYYMTKTVGTAGKELIPVGQENVDRAVEEYMKKHS